MSWVEEKRKRIDSMWCERLNYWDLLMDWLWRVKKREESWRLELFTTKLIVLWNFIEMGKTEEERKEEFNFRLIKFKTPVEHSNGNAKTRRLHWGFKFCFISTYVVMKTMWLDKKISGERSRREENLVLKSDRGRGVSNGDWEII